MRNRQLKKERGEESLSKLRFRGILIEFAFRGEMENLESTAPEDDSVVSSEDDDSDYYCPEGENGKVALNRIISEVKKRRFLYDQSESDYHDLAKVKNAWYSIGKEIKLKFPNFNDDAKALWKNLRDTYVKKKKPRKLPSGSGAKRRRNMKPWVHQEDLVFLDECIKLCCVGSDLSLSNCKISRPNPFVTAFRTASNIRDISREQSASSQDSLQFENSASTVDGDQNVIVVPIDALASGSGINIVSTPSTSSYQPSSRKRSSAAVSDLDEEIRYYITQRADAKKNSRDECDHFGNLVAAELRKYLEEKRRKLRMGLLQMMDEFAEDNSTVL